MAVTLVEASKLSNDVLQAGVLEIIANESPVLDILPFIEVLGNGLTYNRENVPASVAFYDVADTWAEGTATLTQITATLKILGGDADVDNFLKRTRSNVQDLEAEHIRLKALAWARTFLDTFINGDSGVDPKSFDGIDALTGAGQTVSMGTNGATLTLEKVDEMLDKIRGGAPSVLMMSRRTRRQFNTIARAAGYILDSHADRFGKWIQYYNDVPIGIVDHIDDAQTVGTSSDCSTIYAARLEADGLAGLAADGSGIVQATPIGDLETKDASRTRVKGYVSLALFRTDAVSRLVGIRP